MKDVQSFARKIINEGKKQLKKYLDDYPLNYPRLGVPFSKKTMKRIKENLNIVEEEGRQRNVKIEIKDEYVYFEYIFKKPITFFQK